MSVRIRQAIISDAPQWVELIKAEIGDEYPDKKVYDLRWVQAQFTPDADLETWVVESDGRLNASIAILPPLRENKNPIANLGRHFVRPESYADGTASELLQKVNELALSRRQHCVVRILASDDAKQVLYEQLGYACVGFQPFKHMNRVREGTLFYVRLARSDLVPRLPISESLPQIKELATAVLSNLKITNALFVQDGTIGYPLQTEVECVEASFEEFDRRRSEAQQLQPHFEISGAFNMGLGFLRAPSGVPFKSVLAYRNGQLSAGLAFYFDPFDRYVRVINSFTQDDLSMGTLFRHMLKSAQDDFTAVYVEVDVLMTAPRLLKTAEQLGFVPIAYLPEFYLKDGRATDVVKMIKLNMVYSQENASFTEHARSIVDIVDHNFQDQKIGVAIINLLRGLPVFEGLGDGELRKIARLFTQKLFRPGEKIFNKGDSGKEAYVVMRGAIDIFLEENAKPIASISNGQIFGEVAFLDGAARGAIAIATQASILLIIQRSAFYELAQREPHLGMVVMRNIAMELSQRLRKTNVAVMSAFKK